MGGGGDPRPSSTCRSPSTSTVSASPRGRRGASTRVQSTPIPWRVEPASRRVEQASQRGQVGGRGPAWASRTSCRTSSRRDTRRADHVVLLDDGRGDARVSPFIVERAAKIVATPLLQDAEDVARLIVTGSVSRHLAVRLRRNIQTSLIGPISTHSAADWPRSAISRDKCAATMPA